MLACGLTLPALALLTQGATARPIAWPVIGIGSLVISVLVLLRMAGILSVVQVQAVQLAALARSDPLTGAPNRRSWDHELARACLDSRLNATPLCVAMIDMDMFKDFNDSRGHQAGDRLLREAVAAWTSRLGPDDLLARYGGEEFAVLLPGTTLDEAMLLVDSLRPLTPHGQTFSAGVAAWDVGTEPATAVADADQALYLAKRIGRDRVMAYHDLNPAPSGERAADVPRRPELETRSGAAGRTASDRSAAT